MTSDTHDLRQCKIIAVICPVHHSYRVGALPTACFTKQTPLSKTAVFPVARKRLMQTAPRCVLDVVGTLSERQLQTAFQPYPPDIFRSLYV